jgi:hypothetical protein
MEFSSAIVNQQLTYCRIKTQFVIHVYRLPVTFSYTVAITIGTLAVCLLMTFGLLVYEHRKNKQYELVHNVEDEEDEDGEAIAQNEEPRHSAVVPEQEMEEYRIISGSIQSLHAKESVIEEAKAALEQSFSVGNQDVQSSDDEVEETGLVPRQPPAQQHQSDSDEDEEPARLPPRPVITTRPVLESRQSVPRFDLE